MEIKWLEDFLVLASTRNFRVAAEIRCVTQPAFSRRIQALEAWIGAPLVDRSSQPSRLTDVGESFKPVAQKMVDDAYSARDEIQLKFFTEKEKFRVSTLGTLAQVFIPGWLKTLQPFIDFDQFIVKTEYDTIVDYFTALEDGTVDFFITYEDSKNGFLFDETTFTSLKLGEESVVPVVSPNSDGTPRWWLPDKPEGPIPCLHTLSKFSPLPIRNHVEDKYADLTFNSVYETSMGTTLKEMASQGFGLAWVPSTFVANDLASGRLVRAAKAEDDFIVDINIYRCTKSDEPRVDKLWRVLVEMDKKQ